MSTSKPYKKTRPATSRKHENESENCKRPTGVSLTIVTKAERDRLCVPSYGYIL